MSFVPEKKWLALALFLAVALRLPAAVTGPTVHFDYGSGKLPANPLVKFMYFVPLISPQPVTVFTNAGNTQRARILAVNCRTNGATFSATCEFELTGAGEERNVISSAALLKGHEKSIEAGSVLTHQLTAINVRGSGRWSVEIMGSLTNRQPVVTQVCLRFNGHGHASPVTIDLADFGCSNGVIHPQNEMVARVNELIFRRQAGRPQMEVSLASVKARDAANSLWQNFVGDLKGMAANAFLPPLPVAADGHRAMMDFGLALALKKAEFTFPLATRLENPPAGSP